MRKLHLALALALAMCAPSALLAQQPTTPPKSPKPGSGAQKQYEDPAIRGAIQHLQEAKKALESGKKDFGGHRSNALKAVDEALQECREALKTAHNEVP